MAVPIYRTASVLAAGGDGRRFAQEGQTVAKQFIELRGYPIYVWSLLSLAAHETMKDVVVVCPAQVVDSVVKQLEDLRLADKLSCKIHVTAGGGSRQESVYRGLQYLNDKTTPPDYVLVHDAARPFLDSGIVDRVIKGVIEYGACLAGIPASDTIKRINDGVISETFDRSQLLVAQTPQAAAFKIMLAGHEDAARSGFATTDDAAIIERIGRPVYVVPGDPYNIKITQPMDLVVCEALADFLLKDRL